MKRRGISYLTTRKVVIRGSEGGYGADTVFLATEDFIIQEIWDTIYVSRPYHIWCACGFREIEFYEWENAKQPIVTLCVNKTCETHIKGKTPKEGFRCPGLTDYLTKLLKYEYEKNKTKKDR